MNKTLPPCSFPIDNPTFVGFSENALRPLINEQDLPNCSFPYLLAEHLKQANQRRRDKIDNPAFAGFSTRALRPLINEQDLPNCSFPYLLAEHLKQALDLIKENPQFRGFSTTGVLPLINEQDPEIQQKVIALVAKGGERKEELYGTERKMKAAIARFKEVEPEKPQPKYQNKADFAEECAAFWTKARRYWSEEVIEEVLDKARINTR